eukprot:2699446-Rhodomonas_salina.2
MGAAVTSMVWVRTQRSSAHGAALLAHDARATAASDNTAQHTGPYTAVSRPRLFLAHNHPLYTHTCHSSSSSIRPRSLRTLLLHPTPPLAPLRRVPTWGSVKA